MFAQPKNIIKLVPKKKIIKNMKKVYRENKKKFIGGGVDGGVVKLEPLGTPYDKSPIFLL